MFAKRYNPNELIDILAAPSYSPEIIEYVKKVENEPLLSQFLAQKPKLGITGSIAKDYVTKEHAHAIPYVSTKQVKGLHAYIDDAKYISKEADIKWANCRVEDGSIIINKSGNVGAAAVLCCAPYKYANSVSDIINIKLLQNATIDRDYLVVYLNSPYGQKQLQRLSGGAIFSHVSLHAISDIHVYHANFSVQKYIGNKVREAQLLDVWTKKLEMRSSELFENFLKQYGFKELQSDSIIWAALEDRLDPAYYDEKYHFFNAQWFQSKSEPLKNFIASGSYGVLPSSSSYGKGEVRFIRATDLQNANIDVSCFTKVPQEEVVDKARINEGDILLEIKGAISSCEIAASHLQGAYVNGSIYRFTSRNINQAYLTFYLNSEIKKIYCERVSVNNIISYLDLDSIHNLPVLRLPIEVEDLIGRYVTDINLAKKYSFILVKYAKTLIEALIEGQLTEDQLIKAQQALEDGDNTLDKAILKKMSSEGYAVEGAAPLFSDIDELYSLLASANAAADSED